MKRTLAGMMIFCMLLLTGCGESGTPRVEKVQFFEDDGSGSSGAQAGKIVNERTISGADGRFGYHTEIRGIIRIHGR